jgi:hypothetical protein
MMAGSLRNCSAEYRQKAARSSSIPFLLSYMSWNAVAAASDNSFSILRDPVRPQPSECLGSPLLA